MILFLHLVQPQQQVAALNGDGDGPPDEVVAATEGKVRRENGVLHRIVRAADRDARGHLAETEHGEDPVRTRREGDLPFPADGGVNLAVSVEPAARAAPRKIQQRLIVRDGVVAAPSARSAVEMELPAAALEPLLDGEHHVGVVLFHRDAENVVKRGYLAERVEVAQQQIRRQPRAAAPAPAAVGGNDPTSVLLIVCQEGRIHSD